MKKIFDSKRLDFYINKYSIDLIFKENIREHMELFSFEKGEIIYSKGSEIEYMYFHVEGKIKVYTLHDNGKSILLKIYKPLSILGDVELLTDYKIQCNVESLNETVLIGISMDFVRKYADCDTEFLKFIIRNLSSKLYNISNAASINLLFPLESRLASYLLSISDYENKGQGSIEIKMEKLEEVSTLLGTSYRHLNRTLKEFILEGTIEKRKGIITIKKLEKLKELSHGNLYER